VALWQQRASSDPELPVVWDYHVILVRFQRNMSPPSAGDPHMATTKRWHGWVYDFDSRRGFISPWEEYVKDTFLPHFLIDNKFRCMFRVVSANTFLEEFASDRTHMLARSLGVSAVEPSYISPPPTYPPIIGKKAAEKGIRNNLMNVFVNMESVYGMGSVLCDRDFFDLEAILVSL